MRGRYSGFTLIELMTVIAILAILMAIAVPASTSYSVRARISEGIFGIAWAKTAVTETFQSTGERPDRAATEPGLACRFLANTDNFRHPGPCPAREIRRNSKRAPEWRT